MPELPSVQRFTDYLTSHALHKKIEGVEVKDKSLLDQYVRGDTSEKIEGRKIEVG